MTILLRCRPRAVTGPFASRATRRVGARLIPVLALLAACATHGTPPGALSSGDSLPPGVTLAMIALGDSIYHARACVRCHGAAGQGGPNGPVLADTTWLHHAGAYDDIARTITTGVPREALKDPARPFAMNPRGGAQNPLSDEHIRAVAAYVWSLSRR